VLYLEGGMSESIKIIGERIKHLGPTIEFARVFTEIFALDEFEVVNFVPQTNGAYRFGFPEKFISGMQDVLDKVEKDSIPRFGLAIRDVEFSEIESSPLAFFRAGQDAGRKILAHFAL
jgi:hypothetical protein